MSNPKITSVGIAAAFLLFSALLFGERAEAGYFYTGSKVLSLCESSDATDRNQCNAWLMGVSDTLKVMHGWGHYRYVCLPEGVGTVQLRKLVVKGLNEEPEYLHQGASGSVALYLAEAFPCD